MMSDSRWREGRSSIFNMKPFPQQGLIRNQVRIAPCLLNIRSGNLLLTTTAVSILGILESGCERSLQAEGIRCDRIGILYCKERQTRAIRDSVDTGSEDTGVKKSRLERVWVRRTQRPACKVRNRNKRDEQIQSRSLHKQCRQGRTLRAFQRTFDARVALVFGGVERVDGSRSTTSVRERSASTVAGGHVFRGAAVRVGAASPRRGGRIRRIGGRGAVI